jgi:hypothetical protein
MGKKLINISDVFETIEELDIDNQEYLSEVLSKRLIELRRVKIFKRAQEAEQTYREGKVKKGNIKDLWKDLND